MHGRDMRIGHMRHQADAGREKARVVSRSVDGGGEFRRESARDGGDVDSHLFEDAALHQPLHAAPARTSVRIAPLPWREGESAWRIGRLILDRSEEHTSELQSLMRISYAVFCLKKKNNKTLNKQ